MPATAGAGLKRMRYFFHVTDGRKTYRDEEGQDCLTPIAAGVCTARIANELARDTENLPLIVRVIDERERYIASIPVKRFVTGTLGRCC
jgi:uncharacterized protein DUF6894